MKTMDQFTPISVEDINDMSNVQLKTQLGKYSRILTDKYGMNRQDAQIFIRNIEKISTAIQNNKS